MAGRIAQVPCPACGYAYTKVKTTNVIDGQYRRTRACLRPPVNRGEGVCPGFITWEVTAEEMAMLRQIKLWVKKFGEGA